MLGFRQVRGIALAVHTYSPALLAAPVPGFSPDELRLEALSVSELAAVLVPQAKNMGDVLTSAVLRNLGQMVLALCVPAEFEQTQLLRLTTQRALSALERLLSLRLRRGGASVMGGT